jgi:hypothetical protein
LKLKGCGNVVFANVLTVRHCQTIADSFSRLA